MWYIILILIVCVIILFNNLSDIKNENDEINFILKKNREENKKLRNEISEIKKLIDSKTTILENNILKPEEILPQEIETLSNPAKEKAKESKPYFSSHIDTDLPTENQIKKEEKTVLVNESQATAGLEKQTITEEKVYEESAFSKFLKNAEKQFADNWTGILGTAIMVLGIGYLSIYTALKVSPLFRILILWLYAGLLFGAYYFLNKKEKWDKTGLWLRSAGASLFLFGCFGASQIPPLTFITNTFIGYSLIGLGITLNLYVGYIIKKQTFLSLHVILSMLILCVIPEKLLITFILASITCTIGIILSYKEKWEYHLLIVITAFIIFDIWFNTQGTTLSTTQNIMAILGIITVAGSCMFMQYRSIYKNTYFDKAAFITHLTNWVLFAIGLVLHSTGSKFKTIVLFVGAIICLTISLQARKKKIYWLYHLDGIASFILCALSIIMLNDLKVGYDIIACVLYLLILVCLFVVYKENETLLHRIFLGINHVFGLYLIFFCVLQLGDFFDPAQTTNFFATTIILLLIAISVPIISSLKKEYLEVDTFIGDKILSINGILAIAFSIIVILKSNAELLNNAVYYIIISIAVVWTFLKIKFEKPTFDIGRILFYVLSIVIGLYLLNSQEKSYSDWTFALGLFLVVLYNWRAHYFYNTGLIIRVIGIIGINAALFILTKKYLSEFRNHPNLEFIWNCPTQS
jgi:hypothetical protein